MKGKHRNRQNLGEDVQEIFKSTDKNGDGKIDFEEFVQTVCENCQ